MERVSTYLFAATKADCLRYDAARNQLHEALCDSFNTSGAMSVILELVSKANIYMGTPTSISILSNIAQWITRIVHIFGLDAAPYSPTTIGWSDTSTSDSSSSLAINREEVATPYVRLLSTFRDKIRALAMTDPRSSTNQQLLTLCDILRDEQLPQLGVSLDDRGDDGKPALVKFVPAEQLLAEKKEKEDKLKERELRKEELRKEKEKAERAKMEAGKVSHLDMFRNETESWSAWDDEGIPTMDKEGQPVAKSRLKTLKKSWERQKKAHEQYLAWSQSLGEEDR